MKRRSLIYLPVRRNMLFPFTNANMPGRIMRLEDCWRIYGNRIARIAPEITTLVHLWSNRLKDLIK